MSTENVQIIDVESYDADRLRFSEPESGVIPDSKPEIKYKRITLSTVYDDGTEGPIILPTEKLFSYGVQENTSQETGKVTGWSFPLVCYDRSKDGQSYDPTPIQKAFVDTFNAIVEKCKDYLIENREEIEQYELERANLVKFASCLYYKKEKVKNEQGRTVLLVVKNRSPTLYVKLIFSKKKQNFVTKFYEMDDVEAEEGGKEVDPLDYLGAYCHTKAAIKIESIFIGNKISLQVKLYEANVQKAQGGMKRLLARPKADSRVLTQKPVRNVGKVAAPMGGDSDVENNEGSIAGSDHEDEAPVPKSSSSAKKAKKFAPKKIVKRNVKKVASADE